MPRAVGTLRNVAVVVLVISLTTSTVTGWVTGDVLPMTVDMRLPHSVTKAMTGGADGGGVLAFLWGAVSERGTGGDASPYRSRSLPPDYCPRFAISKVAHLSGQLVNEYIQNLTSRRDEDVLEATNGLALRFELDGGLKKSTAWIPMVKVSYSSHASGAQSPFGIIDPELEEDEALTTQPPDGSVGKRKLRIRYLSSVRFEFGYQQGVVDKITSFRAYASYSHHLKESLTLTYMWDEHRSYNPSRALSLVAVLSVVMSMAVMNRALGRGAYSASFTRGQVAIRDRSE